MVLTKMLCGTIGCGSDSKSNSVGGLISNLGNNDNHSDYEDTEDSSLDEADLENIDPVTSGQKRRQDRKFKKVQNGVRDDSPEPIGGVAPGVELTLTQLAEMAARQQQQIDQQHQLLVAKEQRLKFLKQQEQRQQQQASENERLHKLRERVDQQELKLRKLRAVRGQVNTQHAQNSSLSGELEQIKALFNEKEKELSLAVARVEGLSRQLEELRRGRINGLTAADSTATNTTLQELEKLRKELMLRNKLNEQQNSKLALQREALSSRKLEMAKMDARIAELQARLRRKKQQQQLAAAAPGTHGIATQIMEARESEDGTRPSKHNPKYQSLPVGVRLVPPDASKKTDIYDLVKSNRESAVNAGGDSSQDTNKTTIAVTMGSVNNNSVKDTTNKPSALTVQHVKQDSASSDRSNSPRNSPIKPSVSGSRLMSSFAPKPYSGSYGGATVLTSKSTGLNTTADISQPSIIYTASGMPNSDPLDSPLTSTPVVALEKRPSAREMFMMGKQPPPPPPRGAQQPNGSSTPPGRPAQSPPPSVSSPSQKVVTTSQQSPVTFTSQTSTVSSFKPMINTVSSVSSMQPVSSTTVVISATVTVTATNSVSSVPATMTTASIKTTTASTKSTVSKAPAVYPAGGKFFPPLTVDTSVLSVSSPAAASPSGLSPQTSAIVRGATLPVYQVAQSTVVTKPSQQVSQRASPNSSQHQSKPASPLREGSPSKLTSSSPSKAKEGNESPGKFQVATSQKVLFSDRLQSSHSEAPMPPKGPELSPKNNISVKQLNSSSDSTAVDKLMVSKDQTDSSSVNKPSESKKAEGNVDISGSAVSSAISVLMSSSSTAATTGAKPTYRYAPRSVIANTYMSKLGSGALDQYRKNMNQIYSSFPAQTASNNVEGNKENSSGVNNEMTSNPPAPNSPNRADPAPDTPTKTFQSASPGPQEQQHQGSYDHYSNGQSPQSQYMKDNAERLKYRPNAPRPLRRRLSSGGDSPADKPTVNRAFHHDVIRVNNTQDAYNNNFVESTTSFLSKVDNLPFADEDSPKKLPPTSTPTSPPPGESNKPSPHIPLPLRKKKTSLRSRDSTSRSASLNRRVSFDPLALLLDASLEGELDLVKQTAGLVPDPSQANDEGITALHNAICAGHFEIVKFLVEFGCNVNSPDSDGWTPLHCAASCNNLAMVRLLVEHGACVLAATVSDRETAAEKCEEDEDGYDRCSDYLYSIQEKLGIINQGVVYAVFEYESQNTDELSFQNGDAITVLRKGDDKEKDWWWARIDSKEGYVPKNLLGLYPRVPLKSLQKDS